MHTFPTAEPITVEVRNASGDVHVTLADTDTTTVEVTLASGALGFVDEIVRAFGSRRDEDPDRRSRWWEAPSGQEAAGILDRVRVELAEHDDGGTLVVDTDPASRGWRTAFAVQVTAPAGSGVRCHTQSADVTITGTASRLDVRTASGDVVAGDVTDGAHLQSASGDLRLSSVGGDLSCRSASGDIEVSTVGGATSLHSTSGDVRVQAPAGDLEARTVSGDVRVADLTRGIAQITAVSGDVEVGVHPGSLAAVSMSTISGDTRSDLTVSDRPSSGTADDAAPSTAQSSPAQSDPVAAEPAAPVEPAAPAQPALDIRIRTTSGDIRLRRSVIA